MNSERKPKQVLCERATEEDLIEYPGRVIYDGRLMPGRERTCTISKEGKGSCGEDFWEDDGERCRWCCGILSYR